MAVRFLLLLLLLSPWPASACFGPKLFVAVPESPDGELAYAMVSLYVKEKTGVETVQVKEPGGTALLSAKKADLVVAPAATGAVLTLPKDLGLFAGERVRSDLQFTTVIPALSRLAPLLKEADWPAMTERVKQGEGATAVIRAFFKAQRAL